MTSESAGAIAYLDIAAALSDELAGSPPGERVASERALMAAHGVSRPTARAALQQLEHRFVVRRVRGAGTFVNRRVDYAIGAHLPPSGTATFARAGVRSEVRVLAVSAVRATTDVADPLRLRPGDDVVEIVRQTSIGDVVAGHSTTRLNPRLAPDVAQHVVDGTSLLTLLRERAGLKPVRAWCRASLEVPAEDVAECLQLDTAVPSWLVESVNRDGRAGPPFEFTTTWMRADVVRVVFELEQDASA